MVNKATGPDPLDFSLRSDSRSSIEYMSDGRASLTGSLLMSINSSASSYSSKSYQFQRQRSNSGLRNATGCSSFDAPQALLTVRDARLMRNEERQAQLYGHSGNRPSTTAGGVHSWNTSPKVNRSKKTPTQPNEPVLADTLGAAFRAPTSGDPRVSRSSPTSQPKNKMSRAASAAAATHTRTLPQWESASAREANQAAAFGHPHVPSLSDKLPGVNHAWNSNQKMMSNRQPSRSSPTSSHHSNSVPASPRAHHDIMQPPTQHRKAHHMPPQHPEAGVLPQHLANLMEGIPTLLPEKLDAAVAMAIHDAKENGGCHMEGCMLTQLPQQLTRFIKVEGCYIRNLVLQNNRLEDLPSLPMMPNLKTLVLSVNMFKYMPNSIGACKQLTSLDMSKNKLGGEVPFSQSALAPLTALISLDISCNEVAELPAYIDSLCSLSVLRVDHNQLQTLPRSMFSIPKLEIVTASHNWITALPTELGSSPHLTMLAVNNNRLSAIPITIGGLNRQLKDLLLHDNELTVLPRELAYLNSVTHLTTKGNPVIFPPQSICQAGFSSIRRFLQSNASGLEQETLDEMRGVSKDKADAKLAPEASTEARGQSQSGEKQAQASSRDEEKSRPKQESDGFPDAHVDESPGHVPASKSSISDDVPTSDSAQGQRGAEHEQRTSNHALLASPTFKDLPNTSNQSDKKMAPKIDVQPSVPPASGQRHDTSVPSVPKCPRCEASQHQVEMIGSKILSVQFEKEKVERQLEVAMAHLETLITENKLINKELQELLHSKMAHSDDFIDEADILDMENASTEVLARQVNRLGISLREARGELKCVQQRLEESEAQMAAERVRADAAAKVAGSSERNAQRAEDLAQQLEEQKADIERLHKLVASHLEQCRDAEDKCLNAEARSDAMIGQMDGLQGEVAHLKAELALRMKEVEVGTLEKQQMERAMQIENERLQAQIAMLMKEREMLCIS